MDGVLEVMCKAGFYLTCLHPIIKFTGLKLNWPYSSTWRKRRSKRPGVIITRDHF